MGVKDDFHRWWQGARVRVVLSPRGFAQRVWIASRMTTLNQIGVTQDVDGNVIAVALTDDDGQYTHVLWERSKTPNARLTGPQRVAHNCNEEHDHG